jgi:hypothetical protein
VFEMLTKSRADSKGYVKRKIVFVVFFYTVKSVYYMDVVKLTPRHPVQEKQPKFTKPISGLASIVTIQAGPETADIFSSSN